MNLDYNTDLSVSKYHTLLRNLRELEEKDPVVRPHRSSRVHTGIPLKKEFKKRKHLAPMPGLQASHREEEARNFVETMKSEIGAMAAFVVEPEMNGFPVEFVYEKGVFRYGTAMGNGNTGEDVSENLRTIPSFPLRLNRERICPGILAVRGEIYINREGFRQLNRLRIEKGGGSFTGAGDMVARLMRQPDPEKIRGMPLEVIFNEILFNNGKKFCCQADMLRQLERWGLPTSRNFRKCSTFDEIKAYYRDLSGKRNELDHETTGVVIKPDNRSFRLKALHHQRTVPWAHGWKFQPRNEVTRLLDIIVSVGPSGILSPVALVEPVEVEGLKVNTINLPHEKEIKRKDIRPGDLVRIGKTSTGRSGEVIPAITGRVQRGGRTRGKHFTMPEICPVCRSRVVRENDHVICPAGPACEAQAVSRREW